MTGPIYQGGNVREIYINASHDTGSIDNNRRPFPQINGFRPWVRNELDRRRKEWPTPTMAPFVRMTSCNRDIVNKYKYFSLGLHGFDGQDVNIFESTYGSGRDIVGYARNDSGQKVLIGADQLTYVPPNTTAFDALPADNPQKKAINERVNSAQTQQSGITVEGAHPIPGITSVRVKRTGLANPFQVDVSWQCYNQQQLEFLRNHFLIIGNYIVVEWGQKTSNSKQTSSKYLDFGSSDIVSELVDTITEGRTFVIDNYIQPNAGNYDYVVGQVGNFTIDFDPQTNIYKCSTKLVSMGENMWGIGLMSTTTIISDDNTDVTDVNRPLDIHSYFEYGSGFDTLLSILQTDPTGTKYCRPPTNPSWVGPNAVAISSASADLLADTAHKGANPDDDVFISWTAFTRDVMNDIIEMFNGLAPTDDSPESKNTQLIYDKLRADLTALLGLGGPPREELSGAVAKEQRRLYALEWVGNHPDLRSVDPKTMILITKPLFDYADKSWQNGGAFGDEILDDGSGASEYMGKLTKGVWLNAEMIRKSFLDSTTLQQALRTILSKINVAVAGYWQLQLYYDDEIGVYKVIDYKFDHKTNEVPMYVFNSNRNVHHNETVDLKFDTAFPPELITQMMVVSMIQTSSPEEQKKLFKTYPLINSSSPFMFAINWTSLEDILKSEIKSKRDSMNSVVPGHRMKTTSPGLGPTETSVLPTSALVSAPGNTAPYVGNSSSDTGQSGTSRTTPDASPTVPSQQLKGQTAPLPNTTARPPVNTDTFKLTNYPLTPPITTSNYGARPSTGAAAGSRIHGGVDLRAAQGSPVFSATSGVVTSAGFADNDLGVVAIQYDFSHVTRYLHLSAIHVSPGENVRSGQLIGYSGGTPGTKGAGVGLSTGPHLHFEVRIYGKAENPTPYLNALMYPDNPDAQRFANTFGLVPPLSGAGDNQTSDDIVGAKSPTKPPTQQEQRLQDLATYYARKFGNNILALIWLSPSAMRNKITSDGYGKISDKLVNSFISPFPTKTSVEVKIPGLAGISISDAFMVDKLPFIFANYGAFQTIEISDTIEPNGWYTSVRGYFKMMWPAGTGGIRVD